MRTTWRSTVLLDWEICHTDHPFFIFLLNQPRYFQDRTFIWTEYSRLRKPWFRNFGNRHSGGGKLFDWLVYHLSGSAVLSSPEPLCGAVAGFTMPQYLIGFHLSINESAVSFWPDSTDTNTGIFKSSCAVLRGRKKLSVGCKHWFYFAVIVKRFMYCIWKDTRKKSRR